ARGIGVDVAWVDGGTIKTTGNSYAAPHISGMVALIRSKHPALRLEGSVAKGKVLSATGKPGKGVWGKRAAWIDYYGEVGGKTVGLAIMDHPDNPRHPTWWHARAYGLCAANPFGTRAFEGKKQPKGDFLIASGESVTFRWRLVLHRGDAKSAHIGDRHRTWGAAPAKSGKR
ncbi:MAG: PmoA family protein, partial [Planctomycetes bacterium]|nr:PmoA family protein [Planctomycetota bacterium]